MAHAPGRLTGLLITRKHTELMYELQQEREEKRRPVTWPRAVSRRQALNIPEIIILFSREFSRVSVNVFPRTRRAEERKPGE